MPPLGCAPAWLARVQATAPVVFQPAGRLGLASPVMDPFSWSQATVWGRPCWTYPRPASRLSFPAFHTGSNGFTGFLGYADAG
jgi:hypothetical protein